MSRFWHPFGDMHTVAANEVVMERGEGVRVWDASGREYLDATAGLWYCNVGHGRAEIADAAAHQQRRLGGFHTFDRFTNEPVERLSEVLQDLAPFPGARTFFTSSGSEAVESAV